MNTFWDFTEEIFVKQAKASHSTRLVLIPVRIFHEKSL